MRRPTPLPASPTAPTRGDEPSRRRRARGASIDEQPIGDDAAPRHAPAHDATETIDATIDATIDETIDLAPLVAFPPADGATVRPRAVAETGPAADESAEESIGVRDVWRAARDRRRALRAEVRRFTVRQRRRRMVWLGAAAALVLLVIGTVGAAYSPLFAVRTISIVGTSQLDAASVETALAGQLGSPLALVDSSAVKAALVQFPLVESYTLEARPPNDLVVRIVERTPIGVRESASGFTVVDAAGVALSTTETAPEGLPILDVGSTGSSSFQAAGQVMRSLPDDIRAQVTAVAASTADDVTLTLGGSNVTIVWGSADQSAYKALVLNGVMVQRPPDQVNSYDVSSPEAVVVG